MAARKRGREVFDTIEEDAPKFEEAFRTSKGVTSSIGMSVKEIMGHISHEDLKTIYEDIKVGARGQITNQNSLLKIIEKLPEFKTLALVEDRVRSAKDKMKSLGVEALTIAAKGEGNNFKMDEIRTIARIAIAKKEDDDV